jgi:Acetyltransferase (GNAT) domain
MYTHPDFTRRGVGRLVLELCEQAARAEGFTRAELMATMAGAPLYRACGYPRSRRRATRRTASWCRSSRWGRCCRSQARIPSLSKYGPACGCWSEAESSCFDKLSMR